MWGYSNGFLALLEEQEDEFRLYAIDKLLEVVDLEWAQIAEKIDLIVNLAKKPRIFIAQKGFASCIKDILQTGQI
jgi:hypothetical protein